MRFSRQLILLVLLAMPGTAALGMDWVAESNRNTDIVLKAQAAFQPEGVSQLGLEAFDEAITDLRPGVYERQLADNQRLVQLMTERKATAENPKVLQDLDILIQSLNDEIESSRLNHELMLPYYNIPQGMFFGFRGLLDPRVEPHRYPAALVRLKKLNGTADGYQPMTELAKARTAERFSEAGLMGPYKLEVERDLENVTRYIEGLRQVFVDSGLTGWEEDLALLNHQMEAYARWVRQEILPRSRTDHRLPPEIYADNLKNFGVRATPEELIRTAQFGFQEIRAEMRSVARQVAAKRGWDNGDLMFVMQELKKEQIPENVIIDIYKQRLATIEDIIRREQIVTLPDRAANIRLATEAESAAIPAPFMSPPQLVGNTGQYGEFVLVQKNPALAADAAQMNDWNHESVTWALTVHEARPGHEMQFAALVENGTSMARIAYAFNSANVEGWGLYSEAIMNEFLPLEGQLFTLMARLQRAGRMFMDPMVNLGRLTPDDAVKFMVEQVGLSEAMARSEADRYAFRAPGQATSYYYGYMNLQRLRTEVEMLLGDRFEQRSYHDFILAQGLLPPDLLRQAVLDEYVATR